MPSVLRNQSYNRLTTSTVSDHPSIEAWPLPCDSMGDMQTSNAADDSRNDDSIGITVPLRPEHAATLRVVVSSLGSDNGLSIDEIDDVKLAVSEVFTLLADDAEEVGATHAHVGYVAEAGSITITLHRGLDDEELELDALASTILSSVVDRHTVDSTGVTLVKHAAEADS